MTDKSNRHDFCNAMVTRPGFAGALAAILLSLAALLASGDALAQSFSCAKAQESSELAICNSESLLVQDEKLAAMLARQMANARTKPAQQQLTRQQSDWLRLRNQCGANQPCLEIRYGERMADIAGPVPVASFVRFSQRQPKS